MNEEAFEKEKINQAKGEGLGFQTQQCIYRCPAQLRHERGSLRKGKNPP
jgi:hypothetical protein